ncbi:hypothetical protein Scani_18810 [Streptomyces caniferus]|uniref:Uncharacterized protein n=1 Tax=Streptomyces caniferus TaxID=285557 RepID=A0A640S2C2_9ACTN|nr:hypothetical protein Scani_18810 [Streptomyces caniferus]
MRRPGITDNSGELGGGPRPQHEAVSGQIGTVERERRHTGLLVVSDDRAAAKPQGDPDMGMLMKRPAGHIHQPPSTVATHLACQRKVSTGAGHFQ